VQNMLGVMRVYDTSVLLLLPSPAVIETITKQTIKKKNKKQGCFVGQKRDGKNKSEQVVNAQVKI